mmetsp:Transcript_70836/g.189131  ORF Transcript_70836/g.189131 Transcript_70836/m.189131 type:complete len:97 (+) Transcript_70836:277-567(+)
MVRSILTQYFFQRQRKLDWERLNSRWNTQPKFSQNPEPCLSTSNDLGRYMSNRSIEDACIPLPLFGKSKDCNITCYLESRNMFHSLDGPSMVSQQG